MRTEKRLNRGTQKLLLIVLLSFLTLTFPSLLYAKGFSDYKNTEDCFFGKRGHTEPETKSKAIYSECDRFYQRNVMNLQGQAYDSKSRYVRFNLDNGEALFFPEGTTQIQIQDYLRSLNPNSQDQLYLMRDQDYQIGTGKAIVTPIISISPQVNAYDGKQKLLPKNGLSGILAPNNVNDCVNEFLPEASTWGSARVRRICEAAFSY